MLPPFPLHQFSIRTCDDQDKHHLKRVEKNAMDDIDEPTRKASQTQKKTPEI